MRKSYTIITSCFNGTRWFAALLAIQFLRPFAKAKRQNSRTSFTFLATIKLGATTASWVTLTLRLPTWIA